MVSAPTERAETVNPEVCGWSPSLLGVLIASSVASCVVQIQVTIVNVSLPQIAIGLGATIADLQWLVIAYTMSFAALLLPAGALSDRVGAARVFVAGLTVFAISSLGCAVSPNPFAISIARTLQGASAALLVPSSLALLRIACGENERILARAVAIWAAVGGFSFAAGPVVGGALLAAVGWRSIFLVNVVICLVGVGISAKAISFTRSTNFATSIDWPGQVAAFLGMVGVMGAATAGSQTGLTSFATLACVTLATIAGVAFVVVEKRSQTPTLPLSVFRDTRFSVATLFGFIINATYTGVIFIIALYLQEVLSYSTVESGLAFLPLTATFVVANLVAGEMISRNGPRYPMLIGAVVASVGYGLLIPLNSDSSFFAMLPGFVLIPAGMGLTVPAIMTAVLSSVDVAFSGTASATLNASRQAGSAVGVAVLGTLVAAGSASEITGALNGAATVSALLLLVALLLALLMRGPSVARSLSIDV